MSNLSSDDDLEIVNAPEDEDEEDTSLRAELQNANEVEKNDGIASTVDQDDSYNTGEQLEMRSESKESPPEPEQASEEEAGDIESNLDDEHLVPVPVSAPVPISAAGDHQMNKIPPQPRKLTNDRPLPLPTPTVRRDPATTERSNLLNVTKLIIKELIDNSLSQGRTMDDDNVSLQQFFIVMEHVLLHRLKSKRGLIPYRVEFYHVLEQVERYKPEANGMNTSVQEMPNIKSTMGRGRAWLRLALMQKHLSDYFRLLVENKERILVDFYEPGAIMLEEEAMVIAGLLVGLNVIDCNLVIKGEDLDQPMGVIDFSLYLKNNTSATTIDMNEDRVPTAQETQAQAELAAILDQKNYLEELNRHLTATVANLQSKNEVLLTSNTVMKEDLAVANNNVLALQDTNAILQAEKESLLDAHSKNMQQNEQDITTERETYQQSRQGLDRMYCDVQQQLKEETRIRLDVEKELQLQISMRTEIEMAMRLMEKDIHEKQDSVVSLRKQLEEIKTINLEMYNKLQASESSLQHKTQLLVKLEEKVQQMTQSIRDLETKNKSSYSDKTAAEETARKLGQQIADRDIKRSAVETDLKTEKEWRQALQESLDQEKVKSNNLAVENDNLREEIKHYQQLKEAHERLKSTCDDQEKALAELGSHLSQSKLKMDEMMEEKMATKEMQWTDDKDVNNCKKCAKLFSVSRRKHHCRHCGGIYCNECSDNKMPLPSSSKPVRVCDDCQTVLLQRYTAK